MGSAISEPLDLVLYAPSLDPWGAHVGVCLRDTGVLHVEFPMCFSTPLSRRGRGRWGIGRT